MYGATNIDGKKVAMGRGPDGGRERRECLLWRFHTYHISACLELSMYGIYGLKNG